ncbi:trypsin-like peptidase domain-containing protein [Solimonas terrae]|uniref:Trypsin-like serine protease n=1 Tax=Solimonas terrae TaxID=1396819 RepID=A0A6M2BQU6_9GAMM|nr:trypsin-like peptidase domain-containing protein [Solimonas terrae]NGY04427.1 trypsin-like serine protease [Solimonas terrae]
MRAMRATLAALLLIALPFAAQAYKPDLDSLSNVARLHLDADAVASAIAAVRAQPRQFAVGRDLGAHVADGSWDEPQAGVARWRLRLGSDGAESLSFRIDALSLPADAALYVYGADGKDLQGPFTSASNGTLWTPLVRADDAIIEARMPYAEKSRFSLTLGRAFHGYRAFRARSAIVAKGALGDSGACEIDVACPAGNSWQKQIRAAVLLQIAGMYLCSGTLVNNSAQDDRPLILTANHCDVDSGNVSETNVYFNVQKSSCGGNADGPINQVIAGKTVLAKTSGTAVTDYTLFELANLPPSAYDVYYAGWDASTGTPQSGAAIHHPGGDDKKISVYTQSAQSVDNVCIGSDPACRGAFRVDAWAVQWAQGTTEAGSSGSALFDQNGRIVGTLSGGDGDCAGTANNGGTDYFARLDRAWTATSSTGTTLKAALTPDGENKMTLDGKNRSDSGGGSFGWLSLLMLAFGAVCRRGRAQRRMVLRTVAVLGLAFPFVSSAYSPELASLPTVAQVRLNPVTVKNALESAKGQPLQFAVGMAIEAGVADGTWDEPEAGLARWRLRINSSGAHALNFRFDDLQLPEHAQLYLYTNNGADVQGPYTAARNGRFVTPLVRSEDAVIEVRMPYEEKADFSFASASAFHAFRDLDSKSFSNTSGTSGACEFDVACPIGDGYSDQIRSTVLITIVKGLSEYLCSGSLVNNTSEDGTPLVLTANHCGVDSSTIDQTTAYFNVQRSACGSGTVGTVTQNIAGLSVRAGTSGKTVTDYTLFELASKPPSSFDAYYDGWDSRGNSPTSGAVIHHPSGDDKKISTYTQTAQKTDNVRITGGGLLGLSGFSVNAWGVSWANGTTEEGSSGSGLLDRNRHIVGTLSGGNGGCSGTSNNGATDYFARLDQAWTASSVTGVTLKAVLDPGNTGNTVLDGRDASGLGSGSSGGSNSGDGSGSSGGGGGSFGWLGLLPLTLAALRRQRRIRD